ncbi:MAG: hypothetical protein KDJ97_22540 [Anaerolineae bacterium]|nr:hypothetical protein [Anaerolineae bacterium]
MTEVQTTVKYPYLSSDISDDSDLLDIAQGLMNVVYKKLDKLGYDWAAIHPRNNQKLNDIIEKTHHDYASEAAAGFVYDFNHLIVKRHLKRIELPEPLAVYLKEMEFKRLDNERPYNHAVYDAYLFDYRDADKARQLAKHGGVARQLSEMTGVPCVAFYFEAHGDVKAEDFIDKSHPDIELDRGD